jgi:hypothetical protein
MKKFLLLIILVVIIASTSFSQLFENENCGANDNFIGNIFKRPWEKNNELLLNYLDTIGYKTDTFKTFYIVPVKFWIYRKADSTGGLNEKEIKGNIQYLNYYYSLNNTGIQFYLNPEIEYINKNKYFFMRYILQGPFQTFKHKTKGNLNILFVDKLELFKFGKKVKDYNGTFNTISKGVIICSKTSTSSLSHEIGHFFGLKHPHRHWKRGKRKQESVDRDKRFHRIFNHKKNCEKNGDGLCDTPAEPDLTKYSDKNCKYTGWNVVDNWGVVYKPSTINIMSYTKNRECRNLFTKGQVAVMLKTASKNKYSKYWDINSAKSVNYKFDSFEPDFSVESASEIFIGSPQNHTFHLIYAKKKRNRSLDKEDWLYFLNKKDGQVFEINISSGKLKKAQLNIEVYFENNLIEKKSILNEKTSNIKIINPKKGKYFIKIEKISDEKSITDYNIEIKE